MYYARKRVVFMQPGSHTSNNLVYPKYRMFMCCLKDWTSSYAILLKRLNLPTLQSRRTYIKLCMVYRILNEDMYFPPEIIVYRNSSVHTRNYNPLQLLPYSSNTTYFMCSFAPHAVTLWNSLPPSVTGSPSLTSFTHALSYVVM